MNETLGFYVTNHTYKGDLVSPDHVVHTCTHTAKKEGSSRGTHMAKRLETYGLACINSRYDNLSKHLELAHTSFSLGEGEKADYKDLPISPYSELLSTSSEPSTIQLIFLHYFKHCPEQSSKAKPISMTVSQI